MNFKKPRGGKREGAGRPKEKVRMPSPFVLPTTEKHLRKLMKKKTFGEIIDGFFLP